MDRRVQAADDTGARRAIDAAAVHREVRAGAQLHARAQAVLDRNLVQYERRRVRYRADRLDRNRASLRVERYAARPRLAVDLRANRVDYHTVLNGNRTVREFNRRVFGRRQIEGDRHTVRVNLSVVESRGYVDRAVREFAVAEVDLRRFA